MQQQNEMIFGPHAIIEMLKAKRRKLISIYTTKPQPKSWDRVVRYLPKGVGNIQFVSKDVLQRISGTDDHGGIVAYVAPFKYSSKLFDPKQKPFILLLDSVQDVRNLGAILRTAYCVGITGVVIAKKGAAPLTPTVFKTSAGLAEYLDVYQAPSLAGAITDLKKVGYNFYMAVVEGGSDATKIEYNKPACLVIGSEATGIAKDLISKGTPITIPQTKSDISYNASVACGILLFWISQKLK